MLAIKFKTVVVLLLSINLTVSSSHAQTSSVQQTTPLESTTTMLD
jgi:hypothetical protein